MRIIRTFDSLFSFFFMKKKHLTNGQRLRKFFEPVRVQWKDYCLYMLWTLIWPLLGILMTEILPLLTQYIQVWEQNLFMQSVLFLLFWLIFYFVYNHLMRNAGHFGARYWWLTHMWWKFFERFVKSHPTIVEWMWTGKILSKAQKWIETHVNLLNHVVWHIPQFVITLVYATYKVSQYGIWVSLLFFLALIVIFLLVSRIQGYSLKFRKKRNKMHDAVTKHIVRMIMTKTSMMMHGTHAYEQSQLKWMYENMKQEDIKKQLYEHRWFNIPYMFLNGGKVATFAFVWYLIFQWLQTFEDLIVILALWTMLDRAVENMIGIYKQIVRDSIKLDSFRELESKLTPLPWRDTWDEIREQQAALTLDNVSFGYFEEKKIITDLSLRIASGETIALVWPSWGWKSTIMKLIAWHILAQSWAVTRWDQELPNHTADNKHIKLSNRYKHVWYITQEPLVFDGTVRENLLYGVGTQFFMSNDDKKTDENPLQDAIEKSQCQFIYDLPHGLDTIIGERGVRLSWWQRQRLVLAQLLLQRPRVILLDEPTSALDSESEDAITQVIHSLFKDVTMIIVAHRLQTVRQADRILYIENWTIDESWNHNNLLQKDGKYAKLVQLQSSF